MNNTPTVSYIIDAPNDSYLHVPRVGHEAIITVGNINSMEEYTIKGGFASGNVTLAVQNPTYSVKRENSNEAALLDFFGITYESMLKQL
ncbi:hypothetical protein [Oceanobacillus sp. CAU 1775]